MGRAASVVILTSMLRRLATKLLYVEDDEDLRGLIAKVLVDHGYDVTEVASAEDALGRLEEERFDAVLTDYNLPGETGAWLLAEAAARGHLRRTAAVVLTSERKPAGVDGFVVLRKPVDVGVLLGALDDAVGERPVSTEMPTSLPGADGVVDLVLYITALSQESQRAARNLQRVLRDYDSSRIRLSIVDVTTIADDDATWSSALDDDRVIVTPTLVKRSPLPKTWIVGTLVRTDSLREVLSSALGVRDG